MCLGSSNCFSDKKLCPNKKKGKKGRRREGKKRKGRGKRVRRPLKAFAPWDPCNSLTNRSWDPHLPSLGEKKKKRENIWRWMGVMG
jgi:hypothetical protein